jgi:2-polyprenyl-6-hydroxyphenyl methylase/3-demethylubiquinone-9 3-methyltransferase
MGYCRELADMDDRSDRMLGSGYRYTGVDCNQSHGYLLPAVEDILQEFAPSETDRRIFDLGCGNGSVANRLYKQGYEVVGVDPSLEAISHASAAYPHLRVELGSCYDDLAEKFGDFPVVLSLEVVEHVFLPRVFAQTVWRLLRPGGVTIISTPYHGYVKNLALAVSGRLDAHFTALWDYGHIKFWSERTLTALLREAGFAIHRVVRVGRIPPLAKSMIMVAQRPSVR